MGQVRGGLLSIVWVRLAHVGDEGLGDKLA